LKIGRFRPLKMLSPIRPAEGIKCCPLLSRRICYAVGICQIDKPKASEARPVKTYNEITE